MKSSYLLANCKSVDIYSISLDCTSIKVNDYILKMIAMKFARLNASIATVLICLKQCKTCGGHIQKLYVDLLTTNMSEVVNHLTEKVGRFVRFRKPEELELLFRNY